MVYIFIYYIHIWPFPWKSKTRQRRVFRIWSMDSGFSTTQRESLDDLDFLGFCKKSILNPNSGRWIEDDLPFPRDDFEVSGNYIHLYTLPRGPSVLEKRHPNWKDDVSAISTTNQEKVDDLQKSWRFESSTYPHTYPCTIATTARWTSFVFSERRAPRHWWDGRGIEPLKWS